MYEVLRGIVVENNDPNQDSRIKVRLLPHFKDVEDRFLPWIKPYFKGSNSQDGTGNHNIPEVDSVVRVIVTDWEKKNFFWLGAEPLTEYNIYSSFSSDIASNITELGNQTYPQPNQIEIFPDGSAYFMNTETGEKGWYHNSGTYILFDADGNITIYTGTKNIKLYNDNISMEMDNTGDMNIETSGTVNINATNVNIGGDETLTEEILKGTAFLTELISAFNTHIHDVPQAPSGTLPSKTPTVPWVEATNFPTSKSTFNKTS